MVAGESLLVLSRTNPVSGSVHRSKYPNVARSRSSRFRSVSVFVFRRKAPKDVAPSLRAGDPGLLVRSTQSLFRQSDCSPWLLGLCALSGHMARGWRNVGEGWQSNRLGVPEYPSCELAQHCVSLVESRRAVRRRQKRQVLLRGAGGILPRVERCT